MQGCRMPAHLVPFWPSLNRHPAIEAIAMHDDNDQSQRREAKHRQAMEKQKASVDASIQAAEIERGVAILLTGNGKGKSSSAFGMVMRALGYGHRVGVIQFIKGQQLSGEELYLRDKCPDVTFYQMGTGFTWDTQDRSGDIAAAERTWAEAVPLLRDPAYDLVVLDELTYMLAFDYLPEAAVLAAIADRPREQSVVVTGRGGGSALQDIMDTVSEVRDVKHAFASGIKARKGVDY
ncbi:cob(I)alamin adenosyltransferase [Chromatocurvus halotolerans]|uniref:Corrinoid adenosyltransferase n=2 Tax=Chromatocurvus halotolerans TaxID=1132028 RepID=A0A4R2KZR4_9GAMM|nr:cob(I)alamin adenosyltransferase [Chromatocurvus halotolerans]